MARKWVGYVRVSHVGGRTGDRFHSPDEQTTAIETWAKMRGEAVHVLAPELDESGGRQDRPVLAEAIKGIEDGTYCGLVVAYLSRASRNVRHLLEMWDRIEAAGGKVVAIAENIDTSTPSGRLTRTMLAAIAEHELDLHRERFEHLRSTATARGTWQRRQTPKGYVVDRDTRRLTPGDDAAIVRDAFVRRAAGASVSSIAETLQMTSSGVRQLLKNRVYLGELKVGQHVNPDAHPPLVTVEEWEAAQVTVSRPPRSVADGPALLAGLARCAGCGHVMSRTTAKVQVYVCHGRSSAGRCPAPASVTLRLLDEHVTPLALEQLRKIALSTAARDDTDVTGARDDVAAAQRELAAYMEAVSAEDVGIEAFRAAARSRRERVEEAQARLQRALAVQPAMPAVGDVDQAWGRLDAHGRNAVLRGLLEVVVVRRGGGRGSRTPLRERVRIIEAGTGLIDDGEGAPEKGRGIVPIDLPDFGDPGVLGELG